MAGLLVLLVFLFFVPSSSYGENWVHVVGDRYIDGDSITCEDHICRAWTLLTPSIAGKKGVKGFNIYDCREKKFGLLQLIRYGEAGEILFKHNYASKVRWEYIVPDTIQEKEAVIVCGHRTVSNLKPL